eukprot:gene1228-712_t
MCGLLKICIILTHETSHSVVSFIFAFAQKVIYLYLKNGSLFLLKVSFNLLLLFSLILNCLVLQRVNYFEIIVGVISLVTLNVSASRCSAEVKTKIQRSDNIRDVNVTFGSTIDFELSKLSATEEPGDFDEEIGEDQNPLVLQSRLTSIIQSDMKKLVKMISALCLWD